ncbi:MAG: hypothetical protein D3923_00555 [Candidatus Electrothrix sp. AR3]|nr:hypothetical protein [Candidatus Electrothrix sp. AR3]
MPNTVGAPPLCSPCELQHVPKTGNLFFGKSNTPVSKKNTLLQDYQDMKLSIMSKKNRQSFVKKNKKKKEQKK